MWKLAAVILAIGIVGGVTMYAVLAGIFQAIDYLRTRQCGLHLCSLCDVKSTCSWKSEWEAIKRGRKENM